MYIIRDLRTKLQEWRDRFYNAHRANLDNELESFLRRIKKEPPISSILIELDSEARTLNPNAFEQCHNWLDEKEIAEIFTYNRFDDDKERAIYHYSFLEVLYKSNKRIVDPSTALQLGKGEQAYVFVQKYVDPLVHYIYDKLDKGSSVLYLLEKYKKRCEWFSKKELWQLYDTSDRHREDILDQDLRQFLFEQGIDYPFSQPKSPSGEADVVGLLDTTDPLVLEVKVFDRDRHYGKNRIVNGFRQIVSYSNDYNKPIGYLLVFNMDTAEINIITIQNDNKWPASVVFAGKTYFIIFVNLPPLDIESASKRGKIDKITLSEEELTSEVLN